MLGDCLDHHRARGLLRPLSCSGLSRPPSCSGTVLTTFVLGDYPDYDYFSGIHRFPHAALGDCPDHSPTIAQGPLSSATCDLYSHTVERHFIFSHLDLATRLIPRLPASSGTTSVRCTCRCSSYRLYDDWILNLTGNSFLDPGTTCLRHLLPGSGTKWAHFTLR